MKLDEVISSVCEIKVNWTISKWPADGTRGFIGILFYLFILPKIKNMGKHMSLFVCIYCSLELKSDAIIWYGWKVDAGYDEFPSDGK